MSTESLEDDIPPEGEEEFLEPVSEDTPTEDVEELEKVKPAAPVDVDHVRNSRRSVEDYLERKRLKEELGSVFEDDDDFPSLELPDDDDE